MAKNFGTLTQKTNIKTIVNQESKNIDYLFNNAKNKLEKLTVIDAERQIALDNLRKLTQELKEQRLIYAPSSKLHYFSDN